MILSFINIRKVSREGWKPRALPLQRFSRDFANVNEWKIMFDPFIKKLGPADKCALGMDLTWRVVTDFYLGNLFLH